MLNMKAMPAANGGGLAAYLWKEAASLDTPEPPTPKTALDYWVAEGADYEDLVDLAFAEQLTQARAAMPPPDHHHVLHGLSDVGIDHELLRGKAEEDVAAAFERYEDFLSQQVSGVEYRHDTAPELAELLKIDLTAPPQLEELKRLLSARAADGEPIKGKRTYRTSGIERQTMGSLELIFSADKSVSIVSALASPEERQAIVKAQSRAVDVAMHRVLEKVGFLRARRDGLDRRDPADITWVQWQHRMSRRGDPQLHTHVSIPNVVRSRVDGKVGTLDTFALHGFYPKVRETYHRALAAELDKLGLPVKFDDHVPAAVLTNVPDIVLRHFSGRTADAEKWLSERHGTSFGSLTPHQRSVWLSHASAKTRPPKALYFVPGNGHDAWHTRAAGQGYVPPPQFIDPQALQRAGIVHVTVPKSTPGHSIGQPGEGGAPPPEKQRRQPDHRKAPNPRLDNRYNVGGGHYDDGPSRGHRL